MVLWIRTILQNLGFKVSEAPTPMYEYIQPTIVSFKENHLTSRVTHISFPIHYVHAQYLLLTIDSIKFKNTIQPADIGTKIYTYPLFKRHYS